MAALHLLDGWRHRYTHALEYAIRRALQLAPQPVALGAMFHLHMILHSFQVAYDVRQWSYPSEPSRSASVPNWYAIAAAMKLAFSVTRMVTGCSIIPNDPPIDRTMCRGIVKERPPISHRINPAYFRNFAAFRSTQLARILHLLFISPEILWFINDWCQ